MKKIIFLHKLSDGKDKKSKFHPYSCTNHAQLCKKFYFFCSFVRSSQKKVVSLHRKSKLILFTNSKKQNYVRSCR